MNVQQPSKVIFTCIYTNTVGMRKQIVICPPLSSVSRHKNGRAVTGIVGSNRIHGTEYVCNFLCYSVLCRQRDYDGRTPPPPPSKGSQKVYQQYQACPRLVFLLKITYASAHASFIFTACLHVCDRYSFCLLTVYMVTNHKFVCYFQMMMMMISDSMTASVVELSSIEVKIKCLVPILQQVLNLRGINNHLQFTGLCVAILDTPLLELRMYTPQSLIIRFIVRVAKLPNYVTEFLINNQDINSVFYSLSTMNAAHLFQDTIRCLSCKIICMLQRLKGGMT